MREPILVITLGDPASISPEILVKTLRRIKIQKSIKTIIVGSGNILRKFYSFNDFVTLNDPLEAKKGIISLIEPETKTDEIEPGKPSEKSGYAAFKYIEKAVEIMKNHDGVLVTLPVSRNTITQAGIKFEGHTEILKELTNSTQTEMLIVSPNHKVLLLTRHIPLKDVSENLKIETIKKAVNLVKTYLKKYFKIEKPKILFSGLNPHCGDEGLLGEEEKKIIKPAIEQLREEGLEIEGPFAFEKNLELMESKKADLILATYHDQAITPLKIKFGLKLTNLTIGLPFIRASPVHGTAFDIAGKNLANPEGLIYTIEFVQKIRW